MEVVSKDWTNVCLYVVISLHWKLIDVIPANGVERSE